MSKAIKKTKLVEVDPRKEAILSCLNSGMTLRSSLAECKCWAVTYYRWLKGDLEFAKKIEEAERAGIVITEHKLDGLIEKGNLGAIVFYLCNRAPDRWRNIQKVEVGGSLNLKIEPVHYGTKSIANSTSAS